MTQDELIQFYLIQSELQRQRAKRIWDAAQSTVPSNSGTNGISELDWAVAKMNELPGMGALKEYGYDPAAQGVKAAAKAVQSPTPYNLADAAAGLYEGVPGADDMGRGLLTMGVMGMLRPNAETGKKFMDAVFRKAAQGKGGWRERLDDFGVWRSYNNPSANPRDYAQVADDWNTFFHERYPTRGMEVGFYEPQEAWRRGIAEPAMVTEPVGQFHNYQYRDPETTAGILGNWDKAGDMGKKYTTETIWQGEGGLRPGETIWRGDKNALTAENAMKYNSETGPHHALDKHVAEDFARPSADGTGILYENVWEGTGKGYPLHHDLNDFNFFKVVQSLEDDHFLPKSSIKELRDLEPQFRQMEQDAMRAALKDPNIKDEWKNPLMDAVHEQENAALARVMGRHGFDHFSYVNGVEDAGSMAFIPLDLNALVTRNVHNIPGAGIQSDVENLWSLVNGGIEAGLVKDNAELAAIKWGYYKDMMDELLGTDPLSLARKNTKAAEQTISEAVWNDLVNNYTNKI